MATLNLGYSTSHEINLTMAYVKERKPFVYHSIVNQSDEVTENATDAS